MSIADLVLKNADIYTMNEARSKAEALAVKDNKIVYVGDKLGAESFIGETTKIIDAEGRMVLPGFIDAHAHPIMAAFVSTGIMLDVDMELQDILDAVKSYIEGNPDKGVYFGMGYPEWIFNGEGPKKEMLDSVCPDKPLFLLGSSGHEGWANSKAFELAGVDKDYPDPIPGFHYFDRDNEGTPTGNIIESEPVAIMMKALNPFEKDKVENALRDVLIEYNTLGVTCIADCGSFDYMEGLGFPVLENMKKSGCLDCRIMGCNFITMKQDVEGAIEKLKAYHNKYHSDQFNIQTLKIINDGTVESRSASFYDDYADYDGHSEPLIAGDELYNLCLEAAQEGFDIYIHAIGDKAIHETLMAAKHVRDAGYEDVRITNAHTEYVKEDEKSLFGKYNVIANTTSVWHYFSESNVEALGARAKEIFMMKSLKEKGATITLGSDFPVDEIGHEPLKGIEMAATRQTFGQKDALVLEPESERLTIEEAIEGYTVNAAYQMHMENKLGSIEVNKYADMVILDQNIYEVDIYNIHKIPVLMTIANGKIVYDKHNYKLSLA